MSCVGRLCKDYLYLYNSHQNLSDVSAVDIVMVIVTADTESSGHVSRVTCAVVLVARWRSLN